jgi:quercetin dioxygenase-like cupin family protein
VSGQVVRLVDAPALELAPGVSMRPLFGEGTMLNLLEFEAGAEVQSHSHPHEQLGHVLEGELELSIGGEVHILSPGDAYRIPGGTEHGARSERGCLVMDVFHPVREDYRARAADRD